MCLIRSFPDGDLHFPPRGKSIFICLRVCFSQSSTSTTHRLFCTTPCDPCGWGVKEIFACSNPKYSAANRDESPPSDASPVRRASERKLDRLICTLPRAASQPYPGRYQLVPMSRFQFYGAYPDTYPPSGSRSEYRGPPCRCW